MNIRGLLKWMLLLLLNGCVIIAGTEVILRTGKFSYLKNWTEKNNAEYSSPFNVIAENWYFDWRYRDTCINQNRPEFNYPICFNSMGIRDKERQFPKPIGTKRWIAMGDSFTEGWGAPADSTWCSLLEQYLNADEKDSVNFEVMNCGISGSDIFFNYVLLRDKLEKFNPECVMLAINSTEIVDVAIRGGMERFLPDSTVIYRKKAPWWESWFSRSYLVRAFVQTALKEDFLFRTPDEIAEDEKYALDEISACLLMMNAFCRKKKIRMVVIFHPIFFGNELMDDPLLNVKNFCKKTEIESIDLFDSFRNLQQKDDALKSMFWPIDGHYNSEGYAFMAKEINEKLKL